MRERLGDLYDPSGQQAHCFTAQFQCYGKTDEGSNVALLVAIYLGTEKWVADHAWIHRSKQMKYLELERGDIIEFDAVVGKYLRQGKSFSRVEDAEFEFCLKHVRQMRIYRKRGTVNGR